MDYLQLALGVQFIEFDFGDLFFTMKEDYPSSEQLEEWFDEGVFLCQPKTMAIMPLGPALTIERWTVLHEGKKRRSTSTDEYVLVQILHISPMKMNGDDSSRLVLHELVVVAWDCQEDWTPYKPLDQRYKAKRRSEEQFLVVLDRWVNHSVLHACRKGHFGLLFEKSMYHRMLDNSRELIRKVQDEVEWGMSVQLGRTVQDMTQNITSFHRARALTLRVFDLVDIAYVSVRRETAQQSLHGARLLITDELTAVKPSKQDSPEDVE